MHSTTPTAPRHASHRGVLLALLGALLLGALALAAPALAVRTPFDGGPIATDTSTMAANDHSVYAMRFSATSGGANQLAASTTYYVKVRFSTDTATGQPSSGNNRGFVWNGSTWVQESDSDWTKFPTVTTDATGAIAQSPWISYKFGDTTKTGDYALIVSLSLGASGGTMNGTSWVNVTVFDPATAGGWVHEGVDNSSSANKRADIVDHPAPGSPLALRFTEKNTVDDDSNGAVDDERYGPVQNGGFDMAVPVNQALDVRLQKAVWSIVPSGFTLAVPDTDVALGATDATAPSAPGSLTVEPLDTGAHLSWVAATDDTGVAAYRVYRWVDAPVGMGYTAAPIHVATVTSRTNWDDSGLTNGTLYHYFVRAVDAATNVGPRSATADATPIVATSVSLDADPMIVNWGQPWALSGQLKTANDDPVPDATVDLQKSTDGGSTWIKVTTLTPEAGTSTYLDDRPAPLRKTLYHLYYAGDAAHSASTSLNVTVTPRVKLGKPVAPTTITKNKAFTAYGSLTPRQPAGSKTVKIRCYLKRNGAWVFKKNVTATNANSGSASKYFARFSLASTGTWKLVAYSPATAKYAATTAAAEYLRVK